MVSENFENYLNKIRAISAQNVDLVTVTLVHVVGSAPQEIGARMIVSSQGLEFGSVGGGKVEMRAIEEAKSILSLHIEKPQFKQWNLQKDIGMTCGGVVHFYFEPHLQESSWPVVVFGAGHIAQELVPQLLKLACKVICIDPRSEWLDKFPRHTHLRLIQSENMSGLVSDLPNNSFIIICTMGHSTDLPILIEVMKQRERFGYVGNIGSDLKAKRLKSDLLAAGLTEEKNSQFFCPIGENFGQNTPFEISISILAQILKVRDQK